MGPLEGLRVVEVGEGVAGPYCGKLLAGLGATVVKVEPPGGDRTRRDGPFPGDRPDPERSGLFLHLNTGKESVVPGAMPVAEAVARLITNADILVSALDPAALGGSGLDFEALLRADPRLVIVSITPFGLTGPYASYRGGELVAYAASGYMMLTGSPDREPLKAYGELVHYEAGAHAALGALTAIFAREMTGRGQVVDVSVMEAGTFLIGGVEQNAYFHGQVAKRNGTRLLGFPARHSYPSTIRPCLDGFVHCHSNNRHLDLLAALIPNPRLLAPDLLDSMMGHADEIDAIMDPWLATRTRAEIVAEAQSLRLPFTEVREPGEVMAEPHHRERASFVTVEHPGAGPVLQPAAPIRFSATPWETRPAPILGAHAQKWLGSESPAPRDPGMPPLARPTKPLAGIRIVDFTNAVAGPIATFLLSDLGAEVIKVEAPNGRPFHAAGTAPRTDGSDERSYDRIMIFNELNRGKRSVVMDVAKPEGRALFLELVATADAVVQNFSPRVMGNLGLGYGQLREAREDIILVSMPAFGLDGPFRDRISYGPGVDAMSGLSHLTGYADGPPMKPGNFFCDQNAGVHAAFATLAAIRHRRRTGIGQHVELAMIEGEFQVVGDACIDFAMNGRERMRMGNDHPWLAPHGVFPCRGEDRWVAIAVEDDGQWQALCRVIGQPALASDPRFARTPDRYANRTLLQAPIEAWTRQQDHYEAQTMLQQAGVPAAAVLDVAELLRDPHVTARHGFEYVDTPAVGPTPYPRVAFTLGLTPAPVERPGPAFGEANNYVIQGLLGKTGAEYQRLLAAGIVAEVPSGSH
ncbi:MAG: CoA transferase [Chloroflexi bacterium]|nr:CoA transferase [Chloroflexota bacterium]